MSEEKNSLVAAYVARTGEKETNVTRWVEIIEGSRAVDENADPRDHLAALVRDFRVLMSGHSGRWYKKERREWRKTHRELYEFLIKVAALTVDS